MDCLKETLEKINFKDYVRPVYVIIPKDTYEKEFKKDKKELLIELNSFWNIENTFLIEEVADCEEPIREMGEKTKEEVIEFVKNKKKELIEKDILENIKNDNIGEIGFKIYYPPFIAIVYGDDNIEFYPVYEDKVIKISISTFDEHEKFVILETAYVIE